MKYVFITGMGRSGTKFLASVLSRSKQSIAFHEKIGNREFWLLSWYLDKESYTIPFLQKEKLKIESNTGAKLFIDVNSGLQNSVAAIREVFPTARIFHLVRDPRKVVPSIFNRRSEKRVHLIPKTREGFEKWMEYDKLEQVCWNWNDNTQRLLQEHCDLVIFEKLIQDFDYFRSQLTDRIGISDISESTWNEVKNAKVNSTRPKWYRFLYSHLKKKDFVSEHLPEFESWDEPQKKILYDICGETMKQLGYPYPGDQSQKIITEPLY
jgi:hypothetical protein